MGKNKPTHEIRLGRIRAAIWANETEDRQVWFSTTISKSYKNGTEWRDTNTLSRDDLPLAVKALEMAYSWIWDKQLLVQQAERLAASEVLTGEVI